MRIIYAKGFYRIIECQDPVADLVDLKGDTFRVECHPEIDPGKIRQEERAFEQLVIEQGVFGYQLEKWNGEVDKGWEHVDSCWGFIGAYDPDSKDYNHYIVDELKEQIK